MKTLIKVTISIILLAVAVYFLDWETLKNLLLRVDLWVFLGGILTAFSTFIALGIRWHLLLRKIGSTGLLENIKNYLYATFLNSFSPANIGGDVYRFFTLKDKTPDRLELVVILLKERVLGIWSYFLGYLVFLIGLWIVHPELFFDSGKIFFYSGGAVIIAIALLLVFPLFLENMSHTKCVRDRNKLYKGFCGLHDALKFDSIARFAHLMGLSLLALFLWIFTVQLIAFNLAINMPYFQLGAVVILVELIRLIPITIQGVGLREGVFAYLFRLLGESPEDGFILGAVAYLALSISLLFSGLIGSILRTTSGSDTHERK